MTGFWLLLLAIIFIFAIAVVDDLVSKNKLSEARAVRLGFTALGIMLLSSGLCFLYQYLNNGEIHYSPKGIPIVVQDKTGAYLLSFGFICSGLLLIIYNIVFFYRRR